MALERGKVNVFDSSFVIGIDKTIFIVLYLPPPASHDAADVRTTRDATTTMTHQNTSSECGGGLHRTPPDDGVRHRPRAFPRALVLGYPFGCGDSRSALYRPTKRPCRQAARFDAVAALICK